MATKIIISVILISILTNSAAAQMYDRLSRQFYGPFSEPSSTLKGHPITIMDSTALLVRQYGASGKKDSSFPALKYVFRYNKEGDCISITNNDIFNKKKKGFSTRKITSGLSGLETKWYILVKGKKVLSSEIRCHRISPDVYTSFQVRYNDLYYLPDTTLEWGINNIFYTYPLDHPGEIHEKLVRVNRTPYQLVEVQNNIFDKNGNLLFIGFNDSSGRYYNYPKIGFPLPQLSLPDSSLSYSGTKDASFDATVYERNEYNDALRVLYYTWSSKNNERKLIKEEVYTYEYDNAHNWIKCTMVTNYKDDFSENRLVGKVTLRNIQYR